MRQVGILAAAAAHALEHNRARLADDHANCRALANGLAKLPGLEVDAAQFYAPGLAVFAAVSATYTNIGIGVAIYRDEGVLKRIRGTPLPRWVYMGGVVGSGVSIAAVGALIMLGVGFLLYGIEMDLGNVLPAAVTFVVGVASFSPPWPTPPCCPWRSCRTCSSACATIRRPGWTCWATSSP